MSSGNEKSKKWKEIKSLSTKLSEFSHVVKSREVLKCYEVSIQPKEWLSHLTNSTSLLIVDE